MVQNDPRAEENESLKRNNKKKMFFGQFWVFLSIFVRCGAIFWGTKSKKFRKIIFLESIENSLKRILKRKFGERSHFLVQILSSCNSQKLSFMAADLFTCSFYDERSLQFSPLPAKPPLGSRTPVVSRAPILAWFSNLTKP